MLSEAQRFSSSPASSVLLQVLKQGKRKEPKTVRYRAATVCLIPDSQPRGVVLVTLHPTQCELQTVQDGWLCLFLLVFVFTKGCKKGGLVLTSKRCRDKIRIISCLYPKKFNLLSKLLNLQLYIFLKKFFILFEMLGMEPRSSHMTDKYSTLSYNLRPKLLNLSLFSYL